jgi:hypothetical protein
VKDVNETISKALSGFFPSVFDRTFLHGICLSFEQTFHHSNRKPFILCAEECLLLLAFLNFWAYALVLATPR